MNQNSPAIMAAETGKAALRGGVANVPETLVRIRQAFELFDNQSVLLQTAFDNLRRNLAEANKQLSEKNRALSEKVEELRQMSSRLHCILESLADGVLVVNDNLTVERCNPAAEKLLGLERARMEGRTYAEIMNGLGNLDALRQVLATGRTILDEQRTCAIGGHKVMVLASVAPIHSAAIGIVGVVEVLRDVTELRLLEERVQHQKRMAALGEMATSVAHEIRNPLGTIEGFARLLRQDLDREGHGDHTRLATKIIEGAQNLNYVITNLLTYSRPMSLQCDTFAVATLFSSVQDILAGIAEQQGIALSLENPPPATTMYGDIRHLRQVLVNLGRNAIEACQRGGCVRFQATVNKPLATVTVSDNGNGIAAEDLPRIFDPFFTRKESGTGLGLSLCHKIVGAHGGEIAVRSMVGKGTEFTVTIPQLGGGK